MAKERLEKCNDCCFILPKDGKMNVPGKLFLSDELLSHVEDVSIQQVENVACLPGIVGHSLAMPDMHMGYGFCVGGISAYDTKNGLISPGGIGFDINCLAGGSRVLTRDGYFKTIEQFEQDFDAHAFSCLEKSSKTQDSCSAALFMKKRQQKDVFRIITDAGRELIATGDHPIYTPDGMKTVNELTNQKSVRVAVNPFIGVPYEQPSDRVLFSSIDIQSQEDIYDAKSILTELKKRGLLSLQLSAKHVPALIRIIAYCMGDGKLIHTEKSCYATFYGDPEDLEQIRKDVFSLGFTPSAIRSRERDHTIETVYSNVSFSRTEYSVSVQAKSFVALLRVLGCPSGDKVTQSYGVPSWIKQSVLWHKRLFLASYFGAKLSSPATITNHKHTFYAPCFSINKVESQIAGAEIFLSDIASLLADFGITSTRLKPEFSYTRKDGNKSFRSRLTISGIADNLIRLFSSVGFEYNEKKRLLANAATQYLLLKQKVIAHRVRADVIASTAAPGTTLQQSYMELEDSWVNKRFIQRSVYKGRSSLPRIPVSFIGFTEFVHEVIADLGSSGFVWDTVSHIVDEPFNDFVYDFTMNHASHNFVANSFVVSNCGVRVLATDLDVEQVEPFIEPLLDVLYQRVPVGVGVKSNIKLSDEQLTGVLTKGANWALENGYAKPEDLPRTEENGQFLDADPSNVSDRARARGKNQLGTLGAGNHFLEVQVVEKIFDEDVAKRFGITKKGQVVVMIHCGSRGLGHQVCTDYLRKIEKEFPDIMAGLPEKNLAYAPADSQLAKDYVGAMWAAANFAFCNRQVIAHQVRKSFERFFPGCDVRQVYDIAHNIAKKEVHIVEGKEVEVYVHRKGATRAFPPGRPEICEEYRDVGQPVLIPGSMGTASFILVGTEKAMQETFGSSAHGAGRLMSRTKAKKQFDGLQVSKDLKKRSIHVKAASMKGVAEEAPMVYKDVDEVIKVTESAGIARAIVRVTPLGVVKG